MIRAHHEMDVIGRARSLRGKDEVKCPPVGTRHLAIGRPWVTALQFHYLGIAEDKEIPHLTSYLKVMVVICEHNYSVLDI